jgi:hypothetical protein
MSFYAFSVLLFLFAAIYVWVLTSERVINGPQYAASKAPGASSNPDEDEDDSSGDESDEAPDVSTLDLEEDD